MPGLCGRSNLKNHTGWVVKGRAAKYRGYLTKKRDKIHNNTRNGETRSPKPGSVRPGRVLPEAYCHKQWKAEVQKSYSLPGKTQWLISVCVIYLVGDETTFRASEEAWCLRHKVIDFENWRWLMQIKMCLRLSEWKVSREYRPTGQREAKSTLKTKCS